MSRRVLLVINRRKQASIDAAPAVAALIRRHGELVGTVDLRDDGCPDTTDTELVAVLGGDGTLLAAGRCFMGSGVPLVGINTGRVGFMAAFDAASIKAAAPAVFGDAPLRTSAVRTISAACGDDDLGHALNEFVITAGPPYRMIALRLDLDGQAGPLVAGDGLIVSTPTGSTAYNVSAGGPIVAPGVDGMVVTPIAAHSLAFRPIVVPSGTRLDVRIESGNSENGGGTTLVADGQIRVALHEGQTVCFRGDGPEVRFVADTTSSYWRTLREKMHWAMAPKGRDRGG